MTTRPLPEWVTKYTAVTDEAKTRRENDAVRTRTMLDEAVQEAIRRAASLERRLRTDLDGRQLVGDITLRVAPYITHMSNPRSVSLTLGGVPLVSILCDFSPVNRTIPPHAPADRITFHCSWTDSQGHHWAAGVPGTYCQRTLAEFLLELPWA